MFHFYSFGLIENFTIFYRHSLLLKSNILAALSLPNFYTSFRKILTFSFPTKNTFSQFDRAARRAYEESQRDEAYQRRLWENEEKQRRMREDAERNREMEREDRLRRRMEEERRFRMERDMDANRGYRDRDLERSESNSPILPQIRQEQDSARGKNS